MKVLQLGSGEQKITFQPGDELVRVDIREGTKPDVLWDLERFPYPFEDSAFDAIDLTDVIEHLTDIVRVLEEVHRIGKAGCRVHIATPHFSCANSFTDPTHKHHLGVFSFDYFTRENKWDFYTPARFAKRRCELIFYPGLLNSVVRRIARRWPELYERRLTWIFPAWFLSVELEVVK
jgi:SAM-dependent methyltransferase